MSQKKLDKNFIKQADLQHNKMLFDDVEIAKQKSSQTYKTGEIDFSLDKESRPNFPQRLLAKCAYRLGNLQDNFIKMLQFEIEQGLYGLLVPIFLGLGILIYFALPREPNLIALVLAVAISFLITKVRSKMPWLGKVFLALSILFSGVLVAKLHTDAHHPNTITQSTISKISGHIIRLEKRANGSMRYWINVSHYDGKKNEKLPHLIRITSRKTNESGQIGDDVLGLVRLQAASGPLLPHNYDFAFHQYFQDIGAIGYFLGKPKFIKTTAHEKGFGLSQILIKLQKFRTGLRDHIHKILPAHQASLVTALITGDRSGISKSDNLALRQSGLAHILAISGLHMALLSATLFFFIRGGLALSPHLVLHYPIKQWAALTALIVCSLYLLISGAAIATQRAFIMLAIMLLAILAYRKALTLLNVAMAATLVLLIAPQAIVSPGFQMSFGAVIALISVYEIWQKWRDKHKEFDRFDELALWRKFLRFFLRFTLGIVFTSMIAGFATGVLSAFHFHQIAPFGLVANTLAMPIVTALTIPLGLLAMIFMPFALDGPFFYLMGQTVEWVGQIAHWTVHVQPSGAVGSLPILSYIGFIIGLLVFSIFQTKIRLLALPIFIFAGLLLPFKAVPIGFIGEKYDGLAFVDLAAHRLDFLNYKKSKFQADNWIKAFGFSVVEKSHRYTCDEMGCIYQNESSNFLVGVPIKSEAMAGLCKRADLLIHGRFGLPDCSNFLPQQKRPLEIFRNFIERQGTHVIFKNGDGFYAKPVYGRFPRPWTAHRF